MTNEEKAKELRITYINEGCGDSTDIRCACEDMAEWKDQQFKDYLARKKSEYGIDYNVNPIDMLNEIIEELFGEEVTDQSDNDE